MADPSAQSLDDRKDEERLRAVSSADVLSAEYRLLWPNAEPLEGVTEAERLADYGAKAFRNGGAALCLSGGGIRSAAFALGVLQALSRKRVLTGFQYLSTVSGGGYIGAWLQRWIAERGGDADSVMHELAGDGEPAQVSALRENSNFITPKVGLSSNDTWTALAISLRNIVINWLLFGPLLMLVALLPNLFQTSINTYPGLPDMLVFRQIMLAACAFLAAVASFFVCRALPSYGRMATRATDGADLWVSLRILAPLVLMSVLGAFVLSADLLSGRIIGLPGFHLALAVAGGMVAGLIPAYFGIPARKRKLLLRDVPLWLLGAAAAAVTIQLAALSFPAVPTDATAARVETTATDKLPVAAPPAPTGNKRAAAPTSGGAAPTPAPASAQPGQTIRETKEEAGKPLEDSDRAWRIALLATFAPIFLLWTHLVATTVFVAFRKGKGATAEPDADREWLARLAALQMKPMLLWALAAGSALLLYQLLTAWIPGFNLSLPTIVGLLAGSTAVAGGRSTKTGSATGGIGGSLLRYLPLRHIIALATFLFIVALFLLLSRIEQGLAEKLGSIASKYLQPSFMSPTGVGHWLVIAALVVMLLVFGKTISVNRFSLNGLYRNRLSRAFLGGARERRNPQPFTGFDTEDNIRLHQLRPVSGKAPVLYPVINTALNVTASEKLAWQERKAEPFIFSPAYCGSSMLKRDGERTGAFVDSEIYAGNESDLGMPGTGVSLATAISISGAAASPNMGYHSSPATAFLMTLFNVRLGAWLPNPARCELLQQDVRRSDPTNSLRALMNELVGSSDDRGRDIYLSDGGHFENLGLYEMIRRRCRFIVLSDAGADPDCRFEDLGNAVRKIKIDLGIDIRFEELRISSRNRPIDPQFAWALGVIHYPEGKGHLLYVKPSFFGKLPVDIISYASSSDAFPHESTGDQFFSESQFESYRRLGDFFADQIAMRTDDKGRRSDQYASVAEFFSVLEAEHVKVKAKDDDKEVKGTLTRLISSLGFGGRAQ